MQFLTKYTHSVGFLSCDEEFLALTNEKISNREKYQNFQNWEIAGGFSENFATAFSRKGHLKIFFIIFWWIVDNMDYIFSKFGFW